MRNIARELNNSETAFILSPSSNDHEVWVRFFTPTIEVPSCGHATVAAHPISRPLIFADSKNTIYMVFRDICLFN